MPRKGLPLKWDQVGLPVPQWISLNYSWICYRLGFPFASLHILPKVLTSPRSQIRINLSNRGMQTYFGHLQFTHLHTAGFERCMYIILVFFFCFLLLARFAHDYKSFSRYDPHNSYDVDWKMFTTPKIWLPPFAG